MVCTRIHCSNETDGIHQMCARCRETIRVRRQELRKQYIKDGTCTKCYRCPAVEGTTRCLSCSISHNKQTATRRRFLKDAAYNAYGGYVCKCCGETEPLFLTLDHVNNDGAAHRREIGRGAAIFTWLRDNNYPPIIQVLCANCQQGKKLNSGVCPHAKTADSM